MILNKNNIHPNLTDVFIVSNDLSAKTGFTLMAVARNEMYYLPAFIDHYRNLGVKRFIILDDQSDDGSREWLAKQHDVMTLGSKRRFGDPVEPFPSQIPEGVEYRMGMLWRQYLLDTFAINTWCLLVDIDEFIVLPENTNFLNLINSLDLDKGEVIWSIMLDVYPSHIKNLENSRSEAQLNIDNDWYFDGRPHLTFGSKGPEQIYHGSRSRLMEEHRLHQRPTFKKRAKWYLRNVLRWKFQKRPPYFNALTKTPLMFWRDGDILTNIHFTNKPYYKDKLLPMLHFKFTGTIYDRTKYAIDSNVHYKGSFEYHSLEALLETLAKKNSPMTSSVSRRFTSFQDFTETGNACGLD